MTLKPLYYYSDYVSKIVISLTYIFIIWCLCVCIYIYIHLYLIFRVLYIEYSLFGEHAQGIKEIQMTTDVMIIALLKEHLCGVEFNKKHFSCTNLFNPNRRFAG